MTGKRSRALAVAALLAGPIGLAACSGGTNHPAASSAVNAPPCPTTPVDVVISVDQWGSIVSALGGNCAKVTTLLASSRMTGSGNKDWVPSLSLPAAN